MVPLELGQFGRAKDLIDESLKFLEADGTDESPEDKQQRLTEYFASLGFKCRVAVRMDDRHFARNNYILARERLRGRNDTYELNSTVWEMKDVSLPGERLSLAPRALRLAAKAGNGKRIIQILLLVICRPLALHLSKN